MNLSAAGLNLHRVCSRGLILQYAWNWSTIFQTFGRLERIGQRKKVQWTILHVRSTYYDVALHKMNLKMVEQLVLEARLPAHVTHPVLQRVLGHEILRSLASLPFNHYAWVVSPPGHIAEFFGKRARQIGTYLSSLAAVIAASDAADEDDLHAVGDHLGSLVKYCAAAGIDCSQFGLNQYLALLDAAEAYARDHEDDEEDEPIVPIRGLATLTRGQKSREFVADGDSDDERVYPDKFNLMDAVASNAELLAKNRGALSDAIRQSFRDDDDDDVNDEETDDDMGVASANPQTPVRQQKDVDRVAQGMEALEMNTPCPTRTTDPVVQEDAEVVGDAERMEME
ncbi:hypothetical protein GQ53DRAFT_102610 [Thozetella sp. PMI_491]|nr:hypothetical protein GQ53DRAFT_102610 [Thozetella sp. PMI_491]